MTEDELAKLEAAHMEPEFYDFLKVLEMGAKKYAPKNWLRPDGTKASFKDMHASMFRHLAESQSGATKDVESQLHPLLHLACRALMEYTIQQRHIRAISELPVNLEPRDTSLGVKGSF
jgi:hypothetical protein